MSIENIYLDYLVKIFGAFICGLILGLERKARRQPVGIRTLVLISVSSAVLGILSIKYAAFSPSGRGDSSRIAAGVITGIGFLGTGVIIKNGLNIKGLTSAAIVWTSSALGLACGIGLYSVCIISLLFFVFTLLVLDKIEVKLFPAEKAKKITLTFNTKNVDLLQVQSILKANGLIQRDLNMIESIERENLTLIFSVKSPHQIDLFSLTAQLKKLTNLTEITILDE